MHKLQPKSLFVGQNQTFLPLCHSTNDEAHRIGQKGSFLNGYVVWTHFQQGGRGQRGTSWESEAGKNLMMSILLDTSFLSLNNSFDLSLAVSLGVVNAVKSFVKEGISIKWPNDIYIDHKKLGGILIENNIKGNKLRYSVIGIGVNVNQVSFEREDATSLKMKNVNINPLQLGEKVCEQIEKFYLKLKDGEPLKDIYLQNLLGYREILRFKTKDEEFLAKITGISPAGLLELETEQGVQSFDIKEVKFYL